jgi:hypothetical protein
VWFDSQEPPPPRKAPTDPEGRVGPPVLTQGLSPTPLDDDELVVARAFQLELNRPLREVPVVHSHKQMNRCEKVCYFKLHHQLHPS